MCINGEMDNMMSIILQFLTLRQGTDNTFKCFTSKWCIPFNKVSQNLNSHAIPQIFLLLVGSTEIFHLNNSGLLFFFNRGYI